MTKRRRAHFRAHGRRANLARVRIRPVWIVWLLALSLAACSRAPNAERVVLVSIDTLRADRVGAYGDALARTPTLDAAAAAGARFAAAISPTP
ncbi:MAG TPA: hypothetical protein VFT98_11040, partial [Myxococcota bacterium]|nr:hypothetical protein [Myxococcota bacterium]